MTRYNAAALAVYRQRLDSLEEVRQRCAGLDLASADTEHLQRVWLVLEVVNAIEADTEMKIARFRGVNEA